MINVKLHLDCESSLTLSVFSVLEIPSVAKDREGS